MADDTLARMFWARVERGGDGPAQRFKREGAWQTLSWREMGDITREVALGLIALGRKKGEAVGLLSASRAEWVHADFAIFSAGGRTIPIYPSYPPDLIQYIVDDAGIKTLIVEDGAQLAKVAEVKDKMDGLEQVVVMEGYQGKEPWVLTWEALRQLGRDRADALKSELAGRVAEGQPDDIATIVYTSGTTGPPKGVVQTHGNHVFMLKSSEQTLRVKEGDVHLLFLPLAHSFGRLESFAGIYRGLTTAFAENIDRLRENLPEIQPHFICSVPRVFEKVYAGILARADAEKGLKKKIFFWAVGVGKKVSKLVQARQPVPAALAVQHRLADKLVFCEDAGGPRRATALRGVGRRAAVQGDRRVLPRGGHPDPRGLWAHRDLSLAHLQPRGPLQVRNRGAGAAGRRAQDRRGRRDPRARAQYRQGLFQEARGDRRGLPGRRLVRHRRHRHDGLRGLPVHHRSKEGSHRHRGRDQHRAAEHRESPQGRSLHQPGHGARRSAALPGRADHAQPRGARQVRQGGGDSERRPGRRWPSIPR